MNDPVSEEKQPKKGGSNYAAKIEHLLNFDSTNTSNGSSVEGSTATPPPPAYGDERHLVALVLLANPNIVDSANFQNLWISHGRTLQIFCGRLLPTPSKKKTPEESLAVEPLTITCARLVAVLLARILSLLESAAHDNDNIKSSSTILMKLLLDFVCGLSNKQDTPLPLTTQALECLNMYAAQHFTADNKPDAPLTSLLNQFLEPLWFCYLQGMTASSVSSTAVSEELSPDEQLMKRTLQAILNKTCSSDDSPKNATEIHPDDRSVVLQSWKQRLHRSMEELHRNILLRIFAQSSDTSVPAEVESIPRWLKHTLSDLSFSSKDGKTHRQSQAQQSTATSKADNYALQELPQDIQRAWHETLLLFTRMLASHPSLPEMLDGIRMSVVKLILAHVVSPIGTETSEDLRLLAWTTCAAWVDRLEGYDWMLMDDKAPFMTIPMPTTAKTSSKTLGSAAYLCAMIRLASGEWRIQLGYRLSIREGEIQSRASEEHRVGIVQGCAQVLASLVSYLAKIADDIEKKDRGDKRFLSPEALLHLRDSLEDGLQATANYLFQIAEASSSSPPLDQEDAVITDLLATFLTEFDVFDEHTNLDTGEILTALSLAMKCSETIEGQERIITSLIGVLEVARDDSYRVLLLREHGLIDDTMLVFLRQYWKRSAASMSNTNLPSVPWACHLAELWWGILQEHRSELRLDIDVTSISISIIDWMRQVFKGSDGMDSTELGNGLNAALGCFVTLHGDHPPKEQDAQVIQQALQHCAANS